MIRIVPFKASMFKGCLNLMRLCVKQSAFHHYDNDQINAWIGDGLNQKKLMVKLTTSYAYVIYDGATIIAFGNVFSYGYIDCLYVNRDDQGKGIGKLLLNYLESRICHGRTIKVDASDNAYNFFIHNGYSMLKRNFISRNGMTLCNTTMVKPRNLKIFI